MKLNKILIIYALLLVMIVGCTENENINNPENNNLTDSENEPYGKFTDSGRIVKIDNDGFHIQRGENVNVYKTDTERRNNFYIGEYVRLNALDGDLYDIILDEEYDYSTGISGNLFDEASKINVRVVEISRDEKGEMRIYGLAADNKEYDIIAHAETITNFAHSKLKVDDEIFVYPEDISGDIPAVVQAKAIMNRAD